MHLVDKGVLAGPLWLDGTPVTAEIAEDHLVLHPQRANALAPRSEETWLTVVEHVDVVRYYTDPHGRHACADLNAVDRPWAERSYAWVDADELGGTGQPSRLEGLVDSERRGLGTVKALACPR